MSYSNNNPFTIHQMANLTGVKPVTLRAWERRYNLLHPERSEGRYRMYGQQDVDMIRRVTALTDKGISISQAALMVQQDVSEAEVEQDSPWTKHITGLLDAVARLDELALEVAYHKALAEFPFDRILRQVILPLLRQLGARWASGEGAVAEEHFFSVYLRNQLGAQFHHLRTPSNGIRLIAACLPGEHHESGLLIFSLAAQLLGYRVTVLGANMPVEELVTVARQTQAKGIVLTASIKDSLIKSLPALKRLKQEAALPIMLGGPVSGSCLKEIESIGLISLGMDIDNALDVIERELVKFDV